MAYAAPGLKWWNTSDELVVRESPTHNKAACDALCSYLEEAFQALGGRVKVHRQSKAGNHLQVDFAAAARA